ncbi:MAG: oxidoreductase C-terminal domain-containing protein [Pseudorhodoplanes sp.]
MSANGVLLPSCYVSDGPGAEPRLHFWYYDRDRLLAVDAINQPDSYMVAKRLIDAQRSPPPAVISDPSTDLKLLLRN